MKFIRKNGRIIPIKESQAMAKEKQITKSDLKVGASAGLLGGLFWKRKGFQSLVGLASTGHGAGTLLQRLSTHKSTGRAAWEDVKSSVLKSVVTAGAFGVGVVSSAKLSQLSKLKKLGKL